MESYLKETGPAGGGAELLFWGWVTLQSSSPSHLTLTSYWMQADPGREVTLSEAAPSGGGQFLEGDLPESL